jgi:hypothetical protein
MSIDKNKGEKNTAIDTEWNTLIEYAKSEMDACQKRLQKLRKSLSFFTAQRDEGVQYPAPKSARQSKIT